MSKTIEELQICLEELEKRIKAMSKAHTSLELLIEINSYFDTVQHYLNDLEDSFDTHTLNCNTYATQIANLQDQISTINSKLQNPSSGGTVDTTGITAQIESIISKFNLLEFKLNSFMGENTTSLDTIVNDISTLQTEIGSIEDEINLITSEISTINENIGSMQTTITNLSATQNSLSSAQNIMNTNINSVNNRLTTAEKNISTLTNGIDIGTLEERILALENGDNRPNLFYSREYAYNLTPPDKSMYTQLYYFSTEKNNYIMQEFKINYSSIGEGTLTIDICDDRTNVLESKTIDLSIYPKEYTYCRKFIPTAKAQNVKLKFTSTTEITYKTMQFKLFGYKAMIYEYDREVKISCFDNNVFITKYEENCVKCDKLESGLPIDLNNLSVTKDLYDNKGYYIRTEYAPFIVTDDDERTGYKNALYRETTTSKGLVRQIEYGSETNQYITENAIPSSGEVVAERHSTAHAYVVKNSVPVSMPPTVGNGKYEFKNLNKIKPGEWLYAGNVYYNHANLTSPVLTVLDIRCIAMHEDGNLYYLPKRTLTKIYKIAKGSESANAYEQLDGSINVYINSTNSVDKYKLIPDENGDFVSAYICTIDDCSFVYETYNNTIIKRTSNGWVVDTLEY